MRLKPTNSVRLSQHTVDQINISRHKRFKAQAITVRSKLKLPDTNNRRSNVKSAPADTKLTPINIITLKQGRRNSHSKVTQSRFHPHASEELNLGPTKRAGREKNLCTRFRRTVIVARFATYILVQKEPPAPGSVPSHTAGPCPKPSAFGETVPSLGFAH